MGGLAGGWVGKQAGRWAGGKVVGLVDGWVGGQAGGWVGGQAGQQVGRWSVLFIVPLPVVEGGTKDLTTKWCSSFFFFFFQLQFTGRREEAT